MKYFKNLTIFALILSATFAFGQRVEVSLSGSQDVAILNMNATMQYGTGVEASPIRITLKIPEADAPEASRPATDSDGTFNTNPLLFSKVDFQGAIGGFYYLSYVADNPYLLSNMPLEATNFFELSVPGIDFTNAVMEMGVDFGPELGTKMDVAGANQFNFLVPVELTYFNATKDDKFSQLRWETSSEINNDFFDVERSADGKYFEKIGSVRGNGTTIQTQNYDFLDRAPLAGLNYYRLKQVDFNGEYEYSKTETVDFRDGTEGDIRIFPNPSVDFVNITLDRAYDAVTVTNQLGQIVEKLGTSKFTDNYLKLNVSEYAPGVYYMEAKLGTEIVNKQFVKVK